MKEISGNGKAYGYYEEGGVNLENFTKDELQEIINALYSVSNKVWERNPEYSKKLDEILKKVVKARDSK